MGCLLARYQGRRSIARPWFPDQGTELTYGYAISIGRSGLAALFLGCDSSSPRASVAVVDGPHRGTIIPLPDAKGFVELTNEPAVTNPRKPTPTAIAAYFLQSDAKSPLNPAPTDVKFAIDNGAGRRARAKGSAAETVPLTPDPKSDDPAGASRFASKLGTYPLQNMRGTLIAKISGQEISAPVGGGR